MRAPAGAPAPTRAFGARGALLGTTAIWGCSFLVVQRGLADLPLFHLLAARFLLASAIVAPFCLRRREDWRRAFSPPALAVSTALFIGFVLQTAGLRHTTPSRSAFLTALSVLLVPLIAWATGTERPSPRQWISTAIAGAGLTALYAPGEAGAGEFNRGDLLTILAAVVFASHIVLVERALPRTGIGALAAGQFLFVGALSCVSFLRHPLAASDWTERAVFAVVFSGVFATAVAFAGQLYAQSHLTATEAGVILTLEPVFAAAVSIGLGAESFGAPLAVGGALILAAVLLAQWPRPAGRGARSPVDSARP